MPRTGENIYKRKDGRWEGRYIKGRVDGRAKYAAVYAGSYREVKRKLDEAKEEIRKKELPAVKAGKVADIGSRWLSEAAVSLKESSVKKYEDILRCYVLPEFGESELSEITNQQLIDFANSLLSGGGVKGQGLAPSTVAEVLSIMNGIGVQTQNVINDSHPEKGFALLRQAGFQGNTVSGRMKAAVEAPKEKRIERVKVPEEYASRVSRNQ